MIIQLEEAKLKLANIKNQAKEYGVTIKVDDLRDTAKKMDAEMEAPEFWGDQAAATKHLQQLKVIKDKIEEIAEKGLLPDTLKEASSLAKLLGDTAAHDKEDLDIDQYITANNGQNQWISQQEWNILYL